MAVSRLFPILATTDLPRLAAFYETAFGATVDFRFPGADGGDDYVSLGFVGGAAIGIGRDPEATRGGPIAVWLYVDDVDAAYAAALEAGGTSITAPADQVWGERLAQVRDVDGNHLDLGSPA